MTQKETATDKPEHRAENEAYLAEHFPNAVTYVESSLPFSAKGKIEIDGIAISLMDENISALSFDPEKGVKVSYRQKIRFSRGTNAAQVTQEQEFSLIKEGWDNLSIASASCINMETPTLSVRFKLPEPRVISFGNKKADQGFVPLVGQ